MGWTCLFIPKFQRYNRWSFGNGRVIASHILLGMWLPIHAGIKVNRCWWEGPWFFYGRGYHRHIAFSTLGRNYLVMNRTKLLNDPYIYIYIYIYIFICHQRLTQSSIDLRIESREYVWKVAAAHKCLQYLIASRPGNAFPIIGDRNTPE